MQSILMDYQDLPVLITHSQTMNSKFYIPHSAKPCVVLKFLIYGLTELGQVHTDNSLAECVNL